MLSLSDATEDRVVLRSPLVDGVEQMEGGRGMDGTPREGGT